MNKFCYIEYCVGKVQFKKEQSRVFWEHRWPGWCSHDVCVEGSESVKNLKSFNEDT
jgi:hypothetical protein